MLEWVVAHPYLMPFIIAIMRVLDVSMGTIRIVYVVRGQQYYAALLGFFEVLIWITVISWIMANLGNAWNLLGYAAGFATGNVVGIQIEKMMAVGKQVVRYISADYGDKITRVLRSRGYGVTEIAASGREGPVTVALVILNRKRVPEIIRIVDEIDPKTVVTVEDVRHANVVEYSGMSRTRSFLSIIKKK